MICVNAQGCGSSLISRALPRLVTAIFVTIASVGTFAGGIWGVAGIGGAIILFLATWVIDKRWPKPDTSLALLAIATSVFMMINSLYSIDPALSWFDWERLVGVFIPFILLSSPAIVAHANSRPLFPALAIAAFVGAAALGLELDLGGALLHLVKGAKAALTEYNRGMSYIVMLAFPVMAWLWISGRRRFILPFILVLLIPASLTESRSAKLALIVGLSITLMASFWPLLIRWGLMALTVLFCGWPFAARAFFLAHHGWLTHIPPSWHERVEIWDYMSYRIMEKPFFGWGIGVSKRLDFINPHGALYIFARGPEPHPHNVMTQLWVEMGLPGLALGLAFAALTLGKTGRMDRSLVPFALGAWAAAYCISLVAYNFWSDSLFAAFALVGLAFSLLQDKNTKARS